MALFNFRKHKKKEGGERHPKLIVDETTNEYGFMGLTHSSKRGNHKNIALKQNPQKGQSKQSYIRKELRYDSKQNFGEVLKNYELSEEDKIYIIDYLKNKKK